MSAFASSPSEKQALIESFTKASKTGIRVEVQSTFTQLLEAFNNNYLLLFKENAMQANSTLIQESMDIIQTTDDLSRLFLNSTDFIALLTLLSSAKYATAKSSPILKSFEIMKLVDNFESIHNLSTTCEHFIDLLQMIMSHVPSNEILLSETSCILVERYLTLLPNQTSSLKSYSDQYRSDSTTYLRFCSIVSRLISKNDILFTSCVQSGCMDMIWSCCKTVRYVLHVFCI